MLDEIEILISSAIFNAHNRFFSTHYSNAVALLGEMRHTFDGSIKIQQPYYCIRLNHSSYKLYNAYVWS